MRWARCTQTMKIGELAAQYHEQALLMRRKLFGPQSVEAANSFNNLGQVYLNPDPLQITYLFQ